MSNASCLLLLVVGVLAAAAVVSAHPRQHDPCKWNDFHGWTFVAETGEELDEEAMKKLPEAYIQYGWRHYRSGKCSYKGWEQRCPDYWHEKHGGHHFEEHWWDRHFKEPKCLGAACSEAENCCSKNCADGFCCAQGKGAIGDDCQTGTSADNSKCCSGSCRASDKKCCIPTGSKIKCADDFTEAQTPAATAKCCDKDLFVKPAKCSTTTFKCCTLNTNDQCAPASATWAEIKEGSGKCCSGKCEKDGTDYKCKAA